MNVHEFPYRFMLFHYSSSCIICSSCLVLFHHLHDVSCFFIMLHAASSHFIMFHDFLLFSLCFVSFFYDFHRSPSFPITFHHNFIMFHHVTTCFIIVMIVHHVSSRLVFMFSWFPWFFMVVMMFVISHGFHFMVVIISLFFISHDFAVFHEFRRFSCFFIVVEYYSYSSNSSKQ